MKDKIEVGEYVRVNNDNRNCIGIGKVTRLVNESIYVNMNNKYNLPVSFQINNIVKHSKQLIDLVKCKDCMNNMNNGCVLFPGKNVNEKDTGCYVGIDRNNKQKILGGVLSERK